MAPEMSFGILALIVLAGLAGPLLASGDGRSSRCGRASCSPVS